MRKKKENGCIPKKILFVGFGEEYGGLEQIAFSLCDSLSNDKYKFDFLSYYQIPEVTKEKIKEQNSDWNYVTRYSKNFFVFLKDIFSFYSSHPQYDIVYCHANHASMIMYTLPLWFFRKTKVVFHSHENSGQGKYIQKLFRILVNLRCDLKIACSEKAAEWMYGKSKNVQIIYNGIDIEKFKYREDIRNKIRFQYQMEDAYVVGYFSRFVDKKNHIFLIDIFREIIKIKKKAILLLIGDGKCKDIVLKRLDEYHLNDKAIILPHQEQIQDFYNATDIFIFPTKWEAFGLIAIEAQASGLPILMSDRITQAVACTSSTIYKSLDETAVSWAECACNMGINEDRENAWQHVKKAGFDINEMTDRIVSLIENMEG